MSVRALLLTTHRHLGKELQSALVELTDTHLLYCASTIDERPLREVAIHVERPVLAATAIVVGQPWPARPTLPTSVAALQVLLADMAQQVEIWLAATSEESLVQPVTLRWGEFATGADALVNALTHGFVHVGALRGIRAMGGFPTPAVE